MDDEEVVEYYTETDAPRPVPVEARRRSRLVKACVVEEDVETVPLSGGGPVHSLVHLCVHALDIAPRRNEGSQVALVDDLGRDVSEREEHVLLPAVREGASQIVVGAVGGGYLAPGCRDCVVAHDLDRRKVGSRGGAIDDILQSRAVRVRRTRLMGTTPVVAAGFTFS